MARSKTAAARAKKISKSVKKTAKRVGRSVAKGATSAKAKAAAAYGNLKTKWQHRKDEEE